MPFKSKAQRRKFAELLMKGEISEEVYEEWNRSTGKARLPERVKPKTRRKAKKKAKAARPRKAVKRSAKGRAKKATRARAKVKGKRRTR
jgi:hypothetical protein